MFEDCGENDDVLGLAEDDLGVCEADEAGVDAWGNDNRGEEPNRPLGREDRAVEVESE
eukprot:m.132332 g.132332  ORF g.132332 m.132332 type:complete len:58 (+) comp23765_c0_seq2:1856-2029(+)